MGDDGGSVGHRVPGHVSSRGYARGLVALKCHHSGSVQGRVLSLDQPAPQGVNQEELSHDFRYQRVFWYHADLHLHLPIRVWVEGTLPGLLPTEGAKRTGGGTGQRDDETVLKN